MSEPPTDRRPLSRPLIGLVLLLGAAAYPVYWFASRGGTPPERIYVSVRGDAPVFARAIRRRLAHQLTRKGFVVVGPEDADDAPTDLDWERALGAADDAGARYLVHAEVEHVSDRPGLTEGTTFAVATGQLQVGAVDPEEAAPSEMRSLTFGAEGRGDARDALLETASSFATPMAHWAAGDLLSMPALVARLESPEGPRDADGQNGLEEALTKKAGQERGRARYQEVCVESVVQATIDDERGPAPIECIDIDCGERHLYGISEDGAQALVHVEAPTVFVPFAASPAPQVAETLERLELVPIEGGEARTLAVAESFYGYGSMSRDASRVVFVEQASRRFGVVAVDVESTERRVVEVVERPGLVVQARISPDGEWIAIHRKAFNRAHTELHVTPWSGGDVIVVSRRTRVGRWVVVPLRPGEESRQLLAFDGSASYEGSPRPALVDPANPEDVVDLDVGEYVVRQVIGAHDGYLVLLGSPAGDVDHCVIGTRDPATGTIDWVEIATCVQDARLTDLFEISGAAVVSREGDPDDSDPEAIVMNLETGDTSIHTTNRAHERYVRARGRRIVFERTIRSQFPAVHPNAVCWTTR